MMTAWISGYAGKAVLLDGENFWRYQVGVPGRTAGDLADLRALTAWGYEVAVISRPEIAEDDIVAALQHAWRRDRTLMMVLIAIDKEVPGRLRERAVELADKHLADPEVKEDVRRRLYGRSLPTPVANVTNRTGVGRLILELVGLREVIVAMLALWEDAQRLAPASSETVVQARGLTAVTGGFIAAAEAMAKSDHARLHAWFESPRVSSEVADNKEVRSFLKTWAAAVKAQIVEQAAAERAAASERVVVAERVASPKRAGEKARPSARPRELVIQVVSNAKLVKNKLHRSISVQFSRSLLKVRGKRLYKGASIRSGTVGYYNEEKDCGVILHEEGLSYFKGSPRRGDIRLGTGQTVKFELKEQGVAQVQEFVC